MKRVALVCGYNGAGYYGLQRQADASSQPTIELELEKALVSAGALQARNAGALHRVNWSRTSRTDKGVSAAANVVGLDVPASSLTAPAGDNAASEQHPGGARSGGAKQSGEAGGGSWGVDGRTALVEDLNAALPPAVRVWGVVRTDPRFDGRGAAVGRRYEYLLPVWALDPGVGKRRPAQQPQPARHPSPRPPLPATQPPAAGDSPLASNRTTVAGEPLRRPESAQAAGAAPVADAGAADGAVAADGGGQANEPSATATAAGPVNTSRLPAAAEAAAGPAGMTTAERTRLRAEAEISGSGLQLTPLELKRLNLILGVFVGTHCFHNFTSEPADKPQQLRRTIHRAYAEGPIFPGPSPDPEPRQQPSAAHPWATTSPATPSAEPQSQPQPQPAESHPQPQSEASVPGPGPGPGSVSASPGPGTGASGSPAGPGCPYVRIVFIGQGFLMHQIRRMVGLALAVARRAAPPDCIRPALDPARLHVTPPTAPPTGLLMDRAYFSAESYRQACEAGPPLPGAKQGNNPPRPQQQQQQQQWESRGIAFPGSDGCSATDWRSALEQLSDLGQDFKRRQLYRAIYDSGPLELWSFLCGLTEAAFGFRTWAKRPLPPATMVAAGTGAKPATTTSAAAAAGPARQAQAAAASVAAAVVVAPVAGAAPVAAMRGGEGGTEEEGDSAGARVEGLSSGGGVTVARVDGDAAGGGADPSNGDDMVAGVGTGCEAAQGRVEGGGTSRGGGVGEGGWAGDLEARPEKRQRRPSSGLN